MNLYIDIDGVLNRIGDKRPSQVLDMPEGTPERISRLLTAFQPIWCTEWRQRANIVWQAQLRLKEDWPVLHFTNSKLIAILRHAGKDQPWAWIDDHAPRTNLPHVMTIRTEPDIGLTDQHVEELMSFAQAQNAEGIHTSDLKQTA